jgi:HlyD family secretion protein
MNPLLLLFPLMLAARSDAPDRPTFQGYVEGEFIEVAPEVSGRIVELSVSRGHPVEQGDILFRIDDTEATEDVARAEAELARAEAQLANLQADQRPAELAVIEAQISETEALLATARKDFARQKTLFERRVVSEARLDQAREAVAVAEARLLAAERRREAAALPARTPEIEAAERSVASARAGLDQLRARLAKYVASAPAQGRVEEVYYRAGEVASAGSPVLSLLPSGRRKVIFFVPEPARPALAVGAEVHLGCDGCPDGLTAQVTFLAGEAEFTPPVIFSRDTREKLVYRAEAKLAGAAAALPIGHPVDVFAALPSS